MIICDCSNKAFQETLWKRSIELIKEKLSSDIVKKYYGKSSLLLFLNLMTDEEPLSIDKAPTEPPVTDEGSPATDEGPPATDEGQATNEGPIEPPATDGPTAIDKAPIKPPSSEPDEVSPATDETPTLKEGGN